MKMEVVTSTSGRTSEITTFTQLLVVTSPLEEPSQRPRVAGEVSSSSSVSQRPQTIKKGKDQGLIARNYCRESLSLPLPLIPDSPRGSVEVQIQVFNPMATDGFSTRKHKNPLQFKLLKHKNPLP
ncbi:hypothetical protein LXL04_023008 [Taraxacum kok-saghyz]